MDTPTRAGSNDRLAILAVAAFSADVLIYYATIKPLGAWAEAHFGDLWWGILAHYGLRAVSALLFGFALVHWKAVPAADFGLSFRPFRDDAAWTLRLVAILAFAALLFIGLSLAFCRVFDVDLRRWSYFETDRIPWAGYLLCSVVAAPLVEEGIYRSLLTPALRAGYGDRGAILAGALLFYVLHLVYGQPWWMAHYLIAGAILTWAFLRRGRLWICVLLHAGGNLLVVLDDALRDFAPGVFRALVG
jgi:membrane protease YdiL (CAAX protease family)